MHKVSIKPVWSVADARGESLSPRLLELLALVHEHGSLSAACRASGASYRHAWSVVQQGQALIGAALLHMERGKGASLTALGDKLVWAGHRITARLAPTLQSLASELEVEIGSVLAQPRELLRVRASHGFAIEKLLETLAAQDVALDRKYTSTEEAVAAFHDGTCDLAGLHIPEGEFQAPAFKHYAKWMGARQARVVHVATRHQGLMVAPGNPLKIGSVADLGRAGVRFVNRQRGSGTRFLLDKLLQQAHVPVASIAGYELGEFTHAAVAAYVASGMADVGFGLETPARRFKLHFLPVATERYFLLCSQAQLVQAPMQRLLATLRSAAFGQAVNELPGYAAPRAGQVETVAQAFGGQA
jgi:molybdate transport repressor ModE-like protein